MANEAFALSPISARATQPSDEDYDAISEAFMETARGRWFLGEYAKRNRNADTSMVLDAVARIEQSLAAQKQPAPDNRLAEALAGIRMGLEQARAATSAAFDSFALEENLAPVRKGVRVIREISWRWREIGADGRICDLIDQQINAIETSCGNIASADPRTALDAAFDLIGGNIAGFDDNHDPRTEAAAEAEATPTPTPSNEMSEAPLAAKAPAAEAAAVAQDRPAEAVPVEAAASPEPAITGANVEAAETVAEAATVTDQANDVEAGAAPEVTAEVADMMAEADAHDDAVLEMIAAEMSAPDPSDTDFDIEAGDIEPSDIEQRDINLAAMDFADPPPPVREAVAMTREAPVMAAVQPAAPQPPEVHAETSRGPSLGSTLIANGIVRKPVAAANDPLAPIRRMSQAEKIALFS